MRIYATNLTITLITVVTAANSLDAAPIRGGGHHHHGDVIVGRTDAAQLAFEADLDEASLLHQIDPENPLGINGYSGEMPGYEALEEDEQDLFMLEPGADVYLEVIALDPALRLFDPHAGFAEFGLGDTWQLGQEFHTHPLYVLDADHPSFDPDQGEWLATFRFVDLGSTQYTPSDNFTAAFAIPEPASLSLLLLGLAGAFRRR